MLVYRALALGPTSSVCSILSGLAVYWAVDTGVPRNFSQMSYQGKIRMHSSERDYAVSLRIRLLMSVLFHLVITRANGTYYNFNECFSGRLFW